MVLTVLVGTLSIYPVFSALTSSIVLRSSGQINLPNVTAESGSARDIQAAVDWVSAHGGIGSVYIPEGTFNFVEVGESWMTVNIPAGVNLFGATTERDVNDQVVEWKTTLVIPWNAPSEKMFKIVGNGDSNTPSRFSDIKLVGYRYYDSSSTTLPRGISITDVVDFRIDHCYFQDICGGAISAWGHNSKKICGVIDHSYFVNTVGVVVDKIADCTVTYGVEAGREYGSLWEDNVSKVLGQYTDYSVYIEDCYFEKWRHAVASNSGAHYVLRYSTIQDDYGYGSIDAHGWYQEKNGEITQVGTRAVEIYGNTITNAIQSPWGTMIRGGAGVAFDNTFGGGTYDYFIYLTNEMREVPEAEFIWCNDWYIWGNTVTDGAQQFVKYDPKGQIIEDVNYHFHAPNLAQNGFVYSPYQYPHYLTIE